MQSYRVAVASRHGWFVRRWFAVPSVVVMYRDRCPWQMAVQLDGSVERCYFPDPIAAPRGVWQE